MPEKPQNWNFGQQEKNAELLLNICKLKQKVKMSHDTVILMAH